MNKSLSIAPGKNQSLPWHSASKRLFLRNPFSESVQKGTEGNFSLLIRLQTGLCAQA